MCRRDRSVAAIIGRNEPVRSDRAVAVREVRKASPHVCFALAVLLPVPAGMRRQSSTDPRPAHAHCGEDGANGAGFWPTLPGRCARKRPARRRQTSIRGVAEQRFLKSPGLRYRPVKLVPAPFADHYVAPFGRQKPSVAEQYA